MGSFFRTSYGVMAVVIAMYLVKVVVKLGFGTAMDSPLIQGDGYHNASDIFQALLVVAGVYLARRPPSREYPFGWRSIDTLGGLLIGVSLLYAAVVEVFVPSAIGLASAMPVVGEFVSARADLTGVSRLGSGSNAWLGAALMLASAALSAAVGRYQVRVGTANGHASVVADGQETLGDGKIELLAGAGIVLQVLFGPPWIEYVLGLGMAAVMFLTSHEILSNARDVLLHRSFGSETEGLLREAAMRLPGVESIVSLITYRRGTCAVVELDVETRLGAGASEHLRRALTRAFAASLTTEAHGGEVSVSVRCVEPPVCEERWAYLTRRTAESYRLVGSPAEATHLTVCEVTNGTVRSGRHIPITSVTLLSVLREKRVRALGVYAPSEEEFQAIEKAVGRAVPLWRMPTSNLALLGVPLD